MTADHAPHLAPLTVPLEEIAGCFEGVIPAPICTVGADGAPNVTYLSIVHRVDERHVALSRQFFKKTEENTERNPIAQVAVLDPETGRQFLLDLHFDRTETSGPLFERMRTHLDAVAAHEGMANVFSLRGVDVCEVIRSEMVPCDFPDSLPTHVVSLDRIEAVSQRVSMAEDLDALLQVALDACRELVGCDHAFIMLADETGERIYTVASSGYGDAGTGSEIVLGEGLIGLAAARRQSVRVTHMTRELRYAQVSGAAPDEDGGARDEIPLPGLPAVQSQLVTPMLAQRRLVGVVVLQSEHIGAFQASDECLVGIIASQVAMAMTLLAWDDPAAPAGARDGQDTDGTGLPVAVKYYPEDESVFLDNEYLIKGIAGGILWRLLQQYTEEGREVFSNRELRLDPTLMLPDIKDNLEARLILLRKRLEERCDFLRIEKVARGRFRLAVERPVTLQRMPGIGDPTVEI